MVNESTRSESLENTASSLFGKFCKKVAVPALIATTAAGCFNATGYRAPREDEKELRQLIANTQYEMDAGEFAKQNFAEANMTEDELVAKGAVKSYKTPPVYAELAKKFTIDSTEGQALLELEKQNQSINNLFANAKIRRHSLRGLKHNVDFDGLESYAKMNQNDIDAVTDNLKNLSTSLGSMSKKHRDALKALGNKDVDAMAAYNEQGLKTLYRIFNAIADTETLEGHLKEVCDSQKYSADILKSTTGYDQYGMIEGEGRHVLENVIFTKKVGDKTEPRTVRDFVDPNTSFAKDYARKAETTAKEAYEDLLKQVYEEALDPGESSLNTICNVHLGKALEMSKEAYKNNLITGKQFLAVNRVIAKDFLGKMGSGVQESDGDSLNILTDIVIPSIPGYSFVSMVLNLKALDKDKYSPDAANREEAYKTAVVDGNSVNNGFQTRYNHSGSLRGYRVRFYSSAISSGLQIAGGIVYFATKGSKSDSNGNGGGNAVTSFGEDDITPGTNPAVPK